MTTQPLTTTQNPTKLTMTSPPANPECGLIPRTICRAKSDTPQVLKSLRALWSAARKKIDESETAAINALRTVR